jgi:hypothetical protein
LYLGAKYDWKALALSGAMTGEGMTTGRVERTKKEDKKAPQSPKNKGRLSRKS